MNLLAISGSLRRASSNTNLLKAAQLLAPNDITLVIYEGIGDLPHFNPDIEGTDAEPSSVHAFRAAVQAADGVIFSTPEYAHGLPGTLKNALDWIVGSGEMSGKPFMLLNASGRGKFAQASLIETLKTMDGNHLADTDTTASLQGKPLDAEQIAADPEMATSLRDALIIFAQGIPTREKDS